MSNITIVPPKQPQEMNEIFATAYNSGNVENINALFEQNAKVISYMGDIIQGKENFHHEHLNLLKLGGSMVSKNKFCVEFDDIALLSADWEITTLDEKGQCITHKGTSSEVVRKQPSGDWLYIIDNPFSK